MDLQAQKQCPMCGRDNECVVAKGELNKGACWCRQISVPQGLLQTLSEDLSNRGCVCRVCLETLARVSNGREDFERVLVEARAQIARGRIAEGADFYLDEFGNTVFTENYHWKRGSCCGSGCRHCPF